MTVRIDYNIITQRMHRNIVLGEDASIPRGIAINMLPSLKLHDSARLLKKLLGDDGEKPKFRYLAAINLWRINTPLAHEHLLEAANTVKDPEILTAVVKCLGRVGDERALQTVMSIQSQAKGILATQASFAASLISYRLGIPGNDLQIKHDYVEMPSASQVRPNFIAPSQKEIDLFISCETAEPYGIEFSKKSLLQYSCPGGVSMLGLNRQIIKDDALKVLMQRKTFMGVLASKNSEDGHYSVSHLILTSPDAHVDKANILIHRVTGKLAWAGTITFITKNKAEFMIRTAGRLGVVPMELDGALDAQGNISIAKAISTGKVLKKRHPRRLDITPI